MGAQARQVSWANDPLKTIAADMSSNQCQRLSGPQGPAREAEKRATLVTGKTTSASLHGLYASGAVNDTLTSSGLLLTSIDWRLVD